jgi:ankyrin repeat protein
MILNLNKEAFMKNVDEPNLFDETLVKLKQKAPFNEIQHLLEKLAERGHIDDFTDDFGLTISMHASGLGYLEVLQFAHKLGASLEQRNNKTGANLLHYAAQQPKYGGANIVKWVILEKETSDDLLTDRIFVPGKDWNRGNGHTVAFEAVFNNNVEVINALIEIEKQGHKVDFTTPAVHGRSPLGWALVTGGHKIVGLLGSELYPQLTKDEWKSQEDSNTKQFAKREDEEWEERHPEEVPGLELARRVREYIVNGGEKPDFKDVDPNKPYGRFGQPLLILIPTHPDLMIKREDDQQKRYTEIVGMLIERGADPTIREKGLMEVSAGFREVFFGPLDALKLMVDNVEDPVAFVNEVGRFNGYTRLIDAALMGEYKVLELLLEDYDANRKIQGFNGWTACDAAQIYNENHPDNRISEKVLKRLCDGQA